MWKKISLLWASQSTTSHTQSLPVECTIFLDVYAKNPKLKFVDHSPYCNFKSPSLLVEEEFYVKEYVVIYLFRLSLCIPNFTSIASRNCTQHGLEDTVVHCFYGVTQIVVHSTKHPPINAVKMHQCLDSCFKLHQLTSPRITQVLNLMESLTPPKYSICTKFRYKA